jgi:hypothetical protein
MKDGRSTFRILTSKSAGKRPLGKPRLFTLILLYFNVITFVKLPLSLIYHYMYSLL